MTADDAHQSLSDLARQTGLPVPTVHRTLGELLARGALEHNAQGRQRVGLLAEAWGRAETRRFTLGPI
ncbi:helix-turn-helix domain-containing protein [Streptomyces sp. NBC_00683]|uniref:helix-turn-helix domain-containing protein n=1 Tax=Streptomyces sp. NBC_00683 TaxID=2903670 RepID=UPI003FA7AA4D